MAKDDLKERSQRAIVWDLLGLAGGQTIGFIISIVLARLLSPEDFGLVGISVAFISFSQVFVNFGFGSALVQNQHNTGLTYSSVFYVNLITAILITGGLILAAPFIGNFFENPIITDLVRVLSILFVLESLSIVQVSILRRELAFKSLTARQLLAQIAGGAVGIIGAFSGLGLYSLVLFRITSALVSAIVLWRVSDWRPNRQFDLGEVRKLTHYSSYMFLSALMYNGMQQLDVLTVGKTFSPATLGFYSRATNLKNLVTRYSSTSLSRVFFPVLSTLQQQDERFKRVYFKAFSVSSGLTYLLAGVLFMIGPDLILILYGQKWAPSISIFQILVLSIGNFSVNVLIVQAFLSKGMAKKNFQIGILRNLVKLSPLLVAYFFRDLFWFTVAVATVSYLLTAVNILMVGRYTVLSGWSHAKIIYKDVFIFAVGVAGYYLLDPQHLLYRVGCALAFVAIYSVYQWITSRPTVEVVIDGVGEGLMKLKNRRSESRHKRS